MPKGDKGDKGDTGSTGATGNGITSIEKTSTSGLVDTYTITFDNGDTETFNITNGKGITGIGKTGTSGLVDTYTILYDDNTSDTFEVTNGNGITSIEKTGTSGLVDTYTITFDNGDTETFTVTNGNDNIIETIKVQGTAQTVTDKTVDLSVPTLTEFNALAAAKQDVLTAGDSITISSNTISVDVDNELDDNSENPVQNKVLTEKITELESENESLKAQLPTGTGTGEYITLTDSAGDIEWKSIKPNGKTEQDSTSGKNVAGVTGVTNNITKQGDVLTLASGSTSSNFINLEGKVLEANIEYKFELFIEGTTTNNVTSEILLQDENNTAIFDIYRGIYNDITYSFTPTSNVTLKRINLFNASSNPTTGAVSFKIQLRKASTSEGYEPYTGRNIFTKSRLSRRDKECRGKE